MSIRRRDFRDTPHYLAAVASDVVAPLLRAVARVVVHSPPTPPAAWRNGLIIGHGHIGDVLYRTASLELLASALPACRWTYLTTSFAAEVLVGNPAIADILPWMPRAEPESALTEHGDELRARRFDVVLCTEGIRPHAQLITALALRAPNRVGFTHKGMAGLATLGISLDRPLPRTAQFRHMVERITGATSNAPLRPRVFPTADDERAARAEWQRLALDDEHRVVACAVTTRQRVGAVPPDLFGRILERGLDDAPAIRIALIGSTADTPVLQPLAERLGPRAVVTTGQLGVRATVPFLARCSAFLGMDSGPRHLANAAGIPVVYIRNLATSAIEAGSYLATEHDLAPNAEYLSPAAVQRALHAIDVGAASRTLLSVARRAHGTASGTTL